MLGGKTLMHKYVKQHLCKVSSVDNLNSREKLIEIKIRNIIILNGVIVSILESGIGTGR